MSAGEYSMMLCMNVEPPSTGPSYSRTDCLTLKMQAICSVATMVSIYYSIQIFNPFKHFQTDISHRNTLSFILSLLLQKFCFYACIKLQSVFGDKAFTYSTVV
jgi:hypothetical protein